MLKLALAKGLDHVTIKTIADAAAIGKPPGFHSDDKAALCTGTGALVHDLKVFLDQHIVALARTQDILRLVRQVIHANPKAQGVLTRFLTAERDVLADCLSTRMPDRHVAWRARTMRWDTLRVRFGCGNRILRCL